MNKSDNIKSLISALQIFNVKVQKITKNATNPFLKNKYATLSHILENIYTPMVESGLIFNCMPEGDNMLTAILTHVESGEYIMTTFNMHLDKQTSQGLGSGITYARRYALVSMLNLDVDGDDDGNAASGVTGKNEAPKVDENQMPWLNEKQYNQALARINSGENGVIDKLKAAFRIKKAYMDELTKAAS